MTQSYFKFEPVHDEIGKYFILHSGICEEFNSAKLCIDQCANPEGRGEGIVVFVYGPKGSGKTSFITVLSEYCAERRVACRRFLISEGNSFTDLESGESFEADAIVSVYQDNKMNRGVLFFEATDVPDLVVSDPHVSSRLLSGTMCCLSYPQEEELRPILISLLERHYLRLRDKHIDEILQRVPAVPTYFELITQEIEELISEEGTLKISKLKDVLEVHR